MKLTAKQEKFCQGIVSGLNQSDAYRAAYKVRPGTKSESVNVSASKLMSDPNVSQRVGALRKPVIEKLQYGLEEAMNEAQEAFTMAKLKENGGAMVAAATLRAKLNGLLIDRKEIRTGPLDGLEHDDLKEINDALTAIGVAIPKGPNRLTH